MNRAFFKELDVTPMEPCLVMQVAFQEPIELFNRLVLCFSALLLPIARVTTAYPHVLFSPCPVLRMFRSLNMHKHVFLGIAGGAIFVCTVFFL